MKRSLPIALLLLAAVASTSGAQVRASRGDDSSAWSDRPGEAVDLAIALDTSDSMEPLIEAARLTLWEILNSVALVEPTPRLRVALLTYGSPRNDPAQGWVRVETDLTTDLDLVAQRLFELDTGGGQELVARVVRVAAERLSWTTSPGGLKLLFIAGNEPADQDPEVSLRSAAFDALDRGIVVNALYWGSAKHTDAATWSTLAEQASGTFAAIDHRGGSLTLSTPYDDELARLGRDINRTWVPLGEAGRKRVLSIDAQDANAARLGGATAAGRARAKAAPRYAQGWDLVTAVEAGTVDLAEVNRSQLPDDLQHLSAAELEAYVGEQRARRLELEERIAELSALRRQHLVEQVEARGEVPAAGFDAAVQRMLREELQQGGFEVAE